jgi:hypothetical protein
LVRTDRVVSENDIFKDYYVAIFIHDFKNAYLPCKGLRFLNALPYFCGVFIYYFPFEKT